MRHLLTSLSFLALLLGAVACRRGVDAGPAVSGSVPTARAAPTLSTPPRPAATRQAPPAYVAAPATAVGGAPGFARLNVPFETMVAEARGRSKPAVLYVCATWCGACSRMNREVLSDARVQERLLAFPTAKYDPNTPAGRALADRYDIWAYPEMVLVDGQGQELERIKGAGDPERMLRILAKY